MNSKRHKENNQLSLTLEFSSQTSQVVCSTAPLTPQRSASVIAFPTYQSQGSNFRARVIQDLMKTRVMVAD